MFPNQNMRQIGRGVHKLRLDLHSDEKRGWGVGVYKK